MSAGDPVYPVGAGTVLYAGPLWGPKWGDVVLIQHQTGDGAKFVVTYGHINAQVKSGPVSPSTPLGQVMSAWPPKSGQHLHLGLHEGTGTNNVPGYIDDARDGSTGKCDLKKNGVGYQVMINPLDWLSKNSPTPKPKPAEAPTDLQAKAQSKSSITLKWKDSPNESSYQIKRKKEGNNEKWKTIVSVLKKDSASYPDTGLTRNTQYHYEVCALNAQGKNCKQVSTKTKSR